MSQLRFHWFLPTNGGDGRHVVGGGHGVEVGAAARPASVPYLGQIARSAEQLGFDRVYLHDVSREQARFLDVFGREVLPRLRS